MRWAYWINYDNKSTASLMANASKLDYVSPGLYTLDANGVLIGEPNSAITTIIRAGGAKLLPMVQNIPTQEQFSPVLSNPFIRQKAVSTIVDAVLRNGYDGIHIDFEDLHPGDSSGLTQFMADLYGGLAPRGKLTTIAVPAKEDARSTGWAGPYDYSSLGRYTDLMVIMTYSYRTASSMPGSFAPITWVGRCAAYIASQAPAGKVLLGLGVFGFDWDTTNGGKAIGRSMTTISQLQAANSGLYGYDDASQSAWMRYKVGGADRIVWYESERAISAKLGLVEKYNLGGYAIWRLGLEGAESWGALEAFTGSNIGALDWDIPNGHFFTQANGQPAGSKRLGYAITNDGDARFWDEYQRLGGVQNLGYPASHRFRWNNYTVQVMQKGVMQWRPEVNQAYFVNVLDEISLAGKDPWLWQARSVPTPLPVSFDHQKQKEQIVKDRLSLMDDYPAIRERYSGSSNALVQYGLPTSPVQDMGNHLAIRLQRAVFQQWKVDMPWAPAGYVTVANGGDLGKEASLFPKDATNPGPPPK
jgi:spore germination protein YaaH